MKFKDGDYVKVIDREPTSADTKNRTFYPFFCGLSGTVDRIYDDEVCLKVDLDTLPEAILKRHLSIQESIRKKWLENLSGEARNRLTPEEKKFELAYTILVQASDLEKSKAGEAKPAAIKSVRPLNASDETEAKQVIATAVPKESKKTGTSVKPLTTEELEAAELEFLKEREKSLKNKK